MPTKLRPIDPLANLRLLISHWIATRLSESRAVCRADFVKTHRQHAALSVLEQVVDDAWNRSGR